MGQNFVQFVIIVMMLKSTGEFNQTSLNQLLCENSQGILAGNYFHKNAPSLGN